MGQRCGGVGGGWHDGGWHASLAASDHLLEFAIAQARVVQSQVREPRRRRALQRQHADVGRVRRLPRFRFPGARRHRRRRRRRPRRVLEFADAGESVSGEGAGGDVAGQAEVAGRSGDESGVVDRGEDGCGEGGERGGWEGGGGGGGSLLCCGDETRVRARVRATGGRGRARATANASRAHRRRRRQRPSSRRTDGPPAPGRAAATAPPRRARRREGADRRARGAEPCAPSAILRAAASAAPGRRRGGRPPSPPPLSHSPFASPLAQ